ncbi:hypothetical protein MRX96_024647 [Rhipicephalus microplus]
MKARRQPGQRRTTKDGDVPRSIVSPDPSSPCDTHHPHLLRPIKQLRRGTAPRIAEEKRGDNDGAGTRGRRRSSEEEATAGEQKETALTRRCWFFPARKRSDPPFKLACQQGLHGKAVSATL